VKNLLLTFVVIVGLIPGVTYAGSVGSFGGVRSSYVRTPSFRPALVPKVPAPKYSPEVSVPLSSPKATVHTSNTSWWVPMWLFFMLEDDEDQN